MRRRATLKPYEKPVLRLYGEMNAVTRKSFGKEGSKKDPHNIARIRT
jgi:hypothetical protein